MQGPHSSGHGGGCLTGVHDELQDAVVPEVHVDVRQVALRPVFALAGVVCNNTRRGSEASRVRAPFVPGVRFGAIWCTRPAVRCGAAPRTAAKSAANRTRGTAPARPQRRRCDTLGGLARPAPPRAPRMRAPTSSPRAAPPHKSPRAPRGPIGALWRLLFVDAPGGWRHAGAVQRGAACSAPQRPRPRAKPEGPEARWR